ncbi:MAG: winged helix-turn-helix transcriptional regulator [Synergistaceae bacterium]|nr:winged helix-turn-helix transcriptional regulator [Synergistaceae bacterium]
MKYMERRGSGLKKIVTETKKLPGYDEHFLPEFYSTVSSFTVVLKNVNYTGSQADNRNTDFGIKGGINETGRKIIELLSTNPTITTQAVADSLGLSRRSVEYHVSKLKKNGQLERDGAKKNGCWIVML